MKKTSFHRTGTKGTFLTKGNGRTFTSTLLTDESGAVLIITVIVLLLMTLIGISGINTASTDIQVTSNYRIHQLNLISADAAVNRAKSLVAYNQVNTTAPWVNNITVLYAAGTQYLKAGWDTGTTPVLNAINVDAVIADWDNGGAIPAITPATMPSDANVQYVVYINSNSLDGNSVVIARSRKNGGEVILEAGFNKL